MSCSSRIKKSANVDPLFSERSSLRLTQEKAAAAMIGSVRAQSMNDSTLHKFVLRRNNQYKPVIYNDQYLRRSSPGACFTEGNIFTITDRVSQYILKDDNNIIRTGSYYISSNLLDNYGRIIDNNIPTIFFFRGESKSEDVNIARDIYYLKDIYVNQYNIDKIFISMHPLTSYDGSFNYNVFDTTSGIDSSRINSVDDIVSFNSILTKLRDTIGLDSDSPVYARGHSSGGEFCYRLIKDCSLNGMVVSGANFIIDNLEKLTTSDDYDISFVFIIHGVNDSLVPYDLSNDDISYNNTPSSLGIDYYDTIETADSWLDYLSSGDISNIEDIDSSLVTINIGTDLNENYLDVIKYTDTDDNYDFRLWKIVDGTHNIPKKIEEEIRDEMNELITNNLISIN
jgi:poly(3-hydroxybutyrate) depolymerase